MNDPTYELARQNLTLEQCRALVREKEGKQVKAVKKDRVPSIAEIKSSILKKGWLTH